MAGMAFVAVISLFTASLDAADGVLIAQKTTSGDSTQTSQVQIDRNRMRAEIGGANRRVVIFDGTRQLLWLIDEDKKTYNELTKADVDRLGGQVQDAMAMVQAQLANMPPAQRAQLEALMKGRGMAALTAQKTEYRKTGTDKVGKWTCDKYDGFQNNQKTAEVCAVDPAAIGFSPADFEVSRQLGEFFRKLMPQNADQLFTFGKAEEQGFSGLPVRRKTTVAGKESTVELTDVTRQTFPDSIFTVPSGFQKQEFLGGAGRGRQ